MRTAGRPKNSLKTVPLRLSITEPLMDNLEALVPSGLYGKGAPEVAVLLIARGIESLQKEGQLPRWYEPKKDINQEPT
jgi:hypothetical protein